MAGWLVTVELPAVHRGTPLGSTAPYSKVSYPDTQTRQTMQICFYNFILQFSARIVLYNYIKQLLRKYNMANLLVNVKLYSSG